MTTSRPNDSPEESTAVATAQAEAEGAGEAEEGQESAATTAERILTAAASPRASAVPSAMAEPEPEPEPEAKAEPEAASEEAETAESSDTSTAATSTATTGTAEAVAATDQTAASDDTADGPAKATTEAAPGRPHKSLLAGAAILGVLLVSVPFLISGGNGDEEKSSAKSAATPGTVLGGLAGAAPGVVGSESPSPHVSKAPGKKDPKVVVTTGPDGKSMTVTLTPESGNSSGGKKSSTGGKTTTTSSGSGSGSSSASGSGSSSGSSSGSGSTSTGSGTSSDTTVKSTPQSQTSSGGVWIYSHASGRCIGIANSPGAAVGSKLVIWDCYDESYQRWTFVDGTVRSEGKCMNVSGGSTANGALINWTTCNGSGAQQFRLNSSHDLTNPQSGSKCVDVKNKSTANGANLQLWTCGGTPNQKWSTRTP
ncbi:ricin-type beta-trefoil lectin domain protein [Streptomyces sp. NPDC090106]|uniref:ricin-type beta-trefoil lectin domain protein n=1 Tax=Streptomyces sp. NPDC090106 TaxID=3365946 RepID=UPI003822749A